MNEQTLPPLRVSCTWRSPLGLWRYDTWGSHGRPILLIPAILFDRTMWWPAAAELRPHATVIAVDLPGHGGTAGRDRYHPDDLVAELALLLHTLGMRQAPIVVGHASAAPLAVHFAARCSAHAVVAVDPTYPHETSLEPDQYLTAFDLDAIPAYYRGLVTPAFDPILLTAYAACMRPEEPRSRLIVAADRRTWRCTAGNRRHHRPRHPTTDGTTTFTTRRADSPTSPTCPDSSATSGAYCDRGP